MANIFASDNIIILLLMCCAIKEKIIT
jgi:hypothetical protein